MVQRGAGLLKEAFGRVVRGSARSSRVEGVGGGGHAAGGVCGWARRRAVEGTGARRHAGSSNAAGGARVRGAVGVQARRRQGRRARRGRGVQAVAGCFRTLGAKALRVVD